MSTPNRKRTRMEGFDYATPGCYFVTINTRVTGRWFGSVVDGLMVPNDAGRMIRAVWSSLPCRFPGITADHVVVMPDHIHGIVMLGTDPRVDAEVSLSEAIGAFKSESAVRYGRGVREAGWMPYDTHLWHRSFRDTIIRSDRSLKEFIAYIEGNPGRWTERRGR